MHVETEHGPPDPAAWPGEQRVVVAPVTWRHYLDLRAATDETRNLRMAYADGRLEIMSPSARHEFIKTLLARMVESWAIDRDIAISGFGSQTFRDDARQVGLEPDECWFVGRVEGVPDIAFEVVLTSGGIGKLALYHALGVREVWFWVSGALHLYWRGAKQYRRITKSRLLPDLDVALLARLVAGAGIEDQTRVVRQFLDEARRR